VAGQPLVAADGCCEAEEGQGIAGVAFVAVVESAVAGEQVGNVVGLVGVEALRR
jgi:hypothetical protein